MSSRSIVAWRWTATVILALALSISSLSGVASADEDGPKIGAEAKDFTLGDLAGNKVKLSGYRGKVVFLNFWAIWCRPCRMEMPSMEKLYQEYKGKDFVMLAVNMDKKDKSEVMEFIRKNNYSFPVLLDPGSDISEVYEVPYIPATILIDRQGKIVAKEFGARNWATPAVKSKIDELLSKK